MQNINDRTVFNNSSFRTLLFATVILVTVAIGCRKDNSTNNNNNSNNNGTPALQLVADGMVSPLGVVAIPGSSNRLCVIDQVGKIWLIKDGQRQSDPFLDISSKIVTLTPQYDERGLLGLAFHPDYAINGKLYVFYTASPRAGGPEPGVNWNNLTRVAEYRVSSNADKADAGSERVILEADHPQMNHNGGTIAFGPDKYLYISIGDGGGADDVGAGHVTDWYAVNEGGNAQNIYANWMGKILRIDVNNGNPYAVPSDNPFANGSAKGEIWAYGLRNPYRFSFDMGGSRQLYLGDAGQKLFEEVNVIERGGNYGWNVREGDICFNTDSNLLTRPSCPTADSMGNALRSPWIAMKNIAHPEGGGLGTTVIGGNVYRGSAVSSLKGRYIFGMYSQTAAKPDAKIYAAVPGSGYEELQFKGYTGNIGMYLKGFGQDNNGEVYLTTSMQGGLNGATGKVYKIVAAQ